MNKVLSYKIVDIKLDKKDLTLIFDNGNVDKYKVSEGILNPNNYNQCINKDILAYGISGHMLVVSYLEDGYINNIPFTLDNQTFIINNNEMLKTTIKYDYDRKNINISSDGVNVSFKSNIIHNQSQFISEKIIIVKDGYITDTDTFIKYFNYQLGKCINVDKVAEKVYHIDTEEVTIEITTDIILELLQQIKGWYIEYVITNDNNMTLVITQPNQRVVINL